MIIGPIRIGARLVNVAGPDADDAYNASVVDGYGDSFFRYCSAWLDPESVVFDVGANIGMTTLVLAQVAATVHAFEPGTKNFGFLQDNIDLNSLSGVKAHRLAIGARAGSVNFEDNSAYGHISSKPDDPIVQMRSIDEMVDELGLSRVDMIKIDVEGFEPFVIEGARRTIERFNPIIYMEFNSWCLSQYGRVNPSDFSDELVKDFQSIFMVSDGYDVYRPTRGMDLAYRNMVMYRCVSDLVMAKRERPELAGLTEI